MRKTDHAAMQAFTYLFIPNNMTHRENIKALEAGAALEIDIKSGRHSSLELKEIVQGKPSYHLSRYEINTKIQHILDEGIVRRMRVSPGLKVGLMMSSGVDSTFIVRDLPILEQMFVP